MSRASAAGAAQLEYGLGGACMPRQGEFSDLAADVAHATTVLGPLLGSALMLAAWVRAILYSVWTCGPCSSCSHTHPLVHSPHLCIVPRPPPCPTPPPPLV